MDRFVNEKDYALLDSDRYTFCVLSRILGGNNTLVLTDHDSMILCFSGEPFPVWIWNADDASEEEYEKIYLLAKENGLTDGKHRFNIKYGLAEYFIRRAVADGIEFSIETNMFAYDCPESIAPSAGCDGSIHQCTADDIDELVELMDLMHHAIDADYQSEEEYRKNAAAGVERKGMYFWKNAAGKTVACCSWNGNGSGLASINLVYTREEERRKHYAGNLVFQVTEIVRKAGFLPMLYTDADYVASNACYEKIGYVLRGKLCTIGSSAVS